MDLPGLIQLLLADCVTHFTPLHDQQSPLCWQVLPQRLGDTLVLKDDIRHRTRGVDQFPVVRGAHTAQNIDMPLLYRPP